MRKLLIISPYFPPTNAADMHRIRMSLPYFELHGWMPELVTIDPMFSDMVTDKLLSESVDKNLIVHKVGALPKKITSQFGLGSIALRALWQYALTVDRLLKASQFDLIYFSTTQFPVCSLGPYWKRKHKIKYVIDMQDPWYSTYYDSKPKAERPPKHWLSSKLNRHLEAFTMRDVDGLISVSELYVKQLKDRYPRLHKIPAKVLPFGYFERDFEIANSAINVSGAFSKTLSNTDFVYVGRGGHDMVPAVRLIFLAFKKLLSERRSLAERVRFFFIGTSYAPAGLGKPSFMQIAEELKISEHVKELTDRIPFYETIKTLQIADGLIIPGSTAPGYTASKIYPYILAKKPLLGLFQASSSAHEIIKESKAGALVNLDVDEQSSIGIIYDFLVSVSEKRFQVATDWKYMAKFGAESMTYQQCSLFDEV